MNPPNESSKKNASRDVNMEEQKVKEDKVKPLLEMVTEDDVDKNALSQLLALGYDKEISLIALRKVGTQYGSLGYDGLNKAIDFIEKKKIEDLNKVYNPLSRSEIEKEEEEEKKKQKIRKISWTQENCKFRSKTKIWKSEKSNGEKRCKDFNS